MEENFTLPANTSAFCLNVGAYNVCMTIPCRYFREKLHVLIPLWGGCTVDTIRKAHKRTLFGIFALVFINQSFSLNYSCCLAA